MSNVVLLEQARTGRRKTPTILYTWAGALILLLAIAALLSFLTVQSMSSSGDRIINSTGPVVISTQGLVASLAEADAANTAVFLSGLDGGDEDVSQRRLYESAIARAPQQIEDISAGIDDDTSHDVLKEVAAQLTEYSGVVERARLSNSASLPGATEELETSLELTGGDDGMLRNVDVLATRTLDQFEQDVSAGSDIRLFATLVLVITACALIVAQIKLRGLTKRLLNGGLIVATVLTVALTVWLSVATNARVDDLSSADDQVVDLRATAALQTTAFQYKTAETSAIIGENAGALPTPSAAAEMNELIGALSANADTNREAALVIGVSGRWDRYLESSTAIAADVGRSDFDGARSLVAGDGNQNFNGFNTTLEALVLTNQEQFNTAVENADARLAWLSYGALILPLLAAVFTWLGYRPRINEYF